MTLGPGVHLGPYEIVSPLGSGGMGEVYRARDTKLGRDVAIKVLPSSLTGDPERLARFAREAQVLASLNHPNIAAIYHVEETGGSPALVMELVEGETLADRIARGPIAVDEALPIAKQIAEAVEAATITSPAMMTGVGVMLGTAAYMALEQARGNHVDLDDPRQIAMRVADHDASTVSAIEFPPTAPFSALANAPPTNFTTVPAAMSSK
jgi:hypothetical protein